MDLVWLVYVISLLSGFGKMLIAATIISGACMIVLLIYRAAECTQESYYNSQQNEKRGEDAKWAMGHVKTALSVFIAASTLLTLLPSEKTAYMMVGAYAAQKVVENDKVQETGSKVLKLINQKLDEYVDEGVARAGKAAEKVKEEVTK